MKYVALLRGVNVGGRIIKMVDLKSCLESAGFKNLTTVLQSGNVVFESSDDATKVRSKLESAVGQAFNYPAKIFVYPHSRLQPLVDAYPFDRSDTTSQHYIVFVGPGLADRLIAAAPRMDDSVEAIKAGDEVVYWRVTKGLTLKSQFGQLLGKRDFADHTNRNINTIEKLLKV